MNRRLKTKIKIDKKGILEFLEGVKKARENEISPELKAQIWKRLTPEIGQAIIDGTDLIMRLRLGQMTIVADILKRNCSLYEEGKGPDIEGPLYKALELGEYLKCLKEHRDCTDATNCWVTRRGLCACTDKMRKTWKKI